MAIDEAAIILTWNRDVWTWSEMEEEQKKIANGVPLEGDWSVGRRTTIKSGTPFWFLRQGKVRGLLGWGTVLSEPYDEPDFRDPNRRGQSIDIRMSGLLRPDEPIGIPELKRAAPEVRWDNLQSSGSGIGEDSHLRLKKLWYGATGNLPSDDGAELDTDSDGYPEGAMMRVFVNRYERSVKARAECLKAHGHRCTACGMDFLSRYGDVADGYIHVHHTTPVSQMGEGYVVDPVNDLVPLCANCHYVAHRRKPEPYSVQELKNFLSPNK